MPARRRRALFIAFLCALPPGLVAQQVPAAASLAIESYHQALRLARDGNYDAALEALERANRQDPSFARAYTKIVWAWQQLQKPDKASEYFNGLRDTRTFAPYANYGLALFHIQQRQLPQAEAALQRAIELAPDFAPAYTRLVALAVERGEAGRLLTYLRTLLDSNPGNPAVHYALGYLALQQAHWDQALEHLRRARLLAPELWEILDAEYTACYRSDRLKQAEEVLLAMLAKADKTGHLEWKSHITGRIGILQYDRANYPAAVARLQEAIALTRDLGDRVSEQYFRGELAGTWLEMARYRDALAESTAALELARRMGDHRNEGRLVGTVANIYAETAEYQQAIASYRQAIRIARQAGDSANEADQLASLARVYTRVGYYDRALSNLRTAAALARAVRNPWLEGRFLESTGDVYRKLGRYPAARLAYDRALAVARRIGDRLGEASRLAAGAGIRGRMGGAAVALSRFEEALRISRDAGAALIEGRILNDLGSLQLRLSRPENALASHRQALTVGSAAQMPEVIWRARAGIAAAYERQGEPALACASYKDAIATIEQVRANLRIAEEKAGFLEEKIDVYKDLIALLVRLHAKDPGKGHDADAFRYAERARGRSALDLMSEAEKGTDAAIDPVLDARQKELQRRLSRLQGQLVQQYSEDSRSPAKTGALVAALEAADEDYRALRREIHERNPRYADFHYPEPVTLEDTQQSLGDKAVLLEYVVGKNTSFLFAVTRDDQLVVRLPGAASLEARVRELREAITAAPVRASMSTYWVAAQSLYRDLIAPARRLVSGREELIISADGILHYLPFDTLLRPMATPSGEIDPLTLPYLVRDYAISYVPSASVLATVRRHRQSMPRPERTFLAWADPNYGNVAAPAAAVRASFAGASFSRLQRLTYTRAEAQGIAKLYPASASSVFLGGNASEQSVKNHALDGYRFVHFAAHGLLNETNPQFSGLFLSRPAVGSPQGEDGILQVFEVFNLKLNAELVVLSACQTGLGKAVSGEGLVGLTQAFLYAGSSAVAVSLWNVADRSTAELMVRFYGYLRSPGTSKSAALQRAQLALIGRPSTAHPYYWASFSLIGDSR